MNVIYTLHYSSMVTISYLWKKLREIWQCYGLETHPSIAQGSEFCICIAQLGTEPIINLLWRRAEAPWSQQQQQPCYGGWMCVDIEGGNCTSVGNKSIGCITMLMPRVEVNKALKVPLSALWLEIWEAESAWTHWTVVVVCVPSWSVSSCQWLWSGQSWD